MYDFKCDPNQALSFKQSNTKSVGYITHLKIGDIKVDATTKIKDPLGNEVSVVGMLSHVHWEGGRWEPIMFKGLIYVTGADKLWQVQRNTASSSHIELKFAIYQFADEDKKKGYFAAFHVDAELKCKISLRPDGALALMVDTKESTTPNYRPFSFFVSPDNKEAMVLHYANTKGANESLPWGLHHG